MVFILDLVEVLDQGLHWASIAVLHNHIDEVIVRVGLVKIHEVVGSQLPELKKNFPFYKGLMHFIYLSQNEIL